jgi:aryl-alcohol dehydrogenase-like predicted oxidoreductase
VIIGARNSEQLRHNLGAVGWALTPGQIARLNQASTLTAPYPHFPYQRQEGFARLNPAA